MPASLFPPLLYIVALILHVHHKAMYIEAMQASLYTDLAVEPHMGMLIIIIIIAHVGYWG